MVSDPGKHAENKQISVFGLVEQFKTFIKFCFNKWRLFALVVITGAIIGMILSFVYKPKYTAKMSFSLIEGGGAKGGLMDIASSLGLASLMGGSEVFSGDNLLVIMMSPYAIEKTLLTPVKFKGKDVNLIDIYIEAMHWRKKWDKSKKKEVREVQFPVNQFRESFSRVQDSIIHEISESFIKEGYLTVYRVNKKVAMSELKFTSINEEFSKLFAVNLIDQTYKLYKQTKISQSTANLNRIIQTADSIKSLYESALTKSSSISRVNINQALQLALVPRLKQENDAQIYATVYAEVLKNLETVKLDLGRETPIMQIIDTPRYPLEVKKISLVKGIVFGMFFSGVLLVLILLVNFYFISLKIAVSNAESDKLNKSI